jgi:alkanesulfonate monooxygenase SsuD/methylene tetrahydromethanopterin reductase-like flavin-dependent oxidoreductase (luciferase family)
VRLTESTEHIEAYRQAFRHARHQGKSEDVAVLFPIYVAESETQIRQEVETSFMHYFRTVSHQARLGQRDQSTSYAYLKEVRKRMESITWAEVDMTMALYGPSETCIQKIREAYERCKMNQVICWFNPGGLVPHRQVLTSMRRFAEEVIPAVREL